MNLIIQHLGGGIPAHRLAMEPGVVYSIGRAPGAHPGPHWPDPYLSQRHARIWHDHGGWWLARENGGEGRAKALIFRDPARNEPVSEPWLLQDGEWLFISRNGQSALVISRLAEEMLPSPDTPASGNHPPGEPPWSVKLAEADTLTSGLDYDTRQMMRCLLDEMPGAIERWMQPAALNGREIGDNHPRRSEELLFDEVAGVLRMVTARQGLGHMACAFVLADEEAIGRTLNLTAAEAAGLGPDARGWRFLNAEPSLDANFRPSRQVMREMLQTEPGTTGTWRRQSPSPGALDASLSGPDEWVVGQLLKASWDPVDHQPGCLRIEGKKVLLYLANQGGGGGPPAFLLPLLRSVALQVSSLLETREHQRVEANLARYFSPRLRQIVRQAPSALAPAVHPCTVVFCDRRGSSLAAEAAVGRDALLASLHENTVMTGRMATEIFACEGVVAEFTGDGVLGLWGWPATDGSGSHARQAVEAAMRIAEEMREHLTPDPEVAEMMGRIHFGRTGRRETFDVRLPAIRIGISTGDIAVGNMGLGQQMNVSVYGAAVNFGARLESLGKWFRLPIIVSEETRRALGGAFPTRCLCHLQPAGFSNAYPIHELIIPREHGGSGITTGQAAGYEEALAHFTGRRFAMAIEILTALIGQGDVGALWLHRTASEYQIHPPPEDWSGQIAAPGK